MTTKLAVIAALSLNNVIGRNGGIPWKLKDDMKFFKDTTIGWPVIMGRKTWDSIGRPLPGRINVVVTRNTELRIPGVMVVHSLEEALEYVKHSEWAFIIGGSTLYEEALLKSCKLLLTEVSADVEGDTYFPKVEYSKFDSKVLERHSANERNDHDFIITEYVRR